MTQNTYTPLDTLEKALRNWWLIVALIVIGTSIGWYASRITPPLYEAQAEIATGIDSARVGSINEEEYDMAIDMAGSVMKSTEVMRRVINAAREQEIELTGANLQNIVLVERKADAWAFRAQYTDPQKAAILANLWAEEAKKELDKASEHARKAEQIQQYLDTLSTCKNAPANSDLCNLTNLQTEMDATNTSLQAELEASQGIFPGIRYHWNIQAETPSTPVQYQRKFFLLAGAGLGLLIGIAFLHSDFRNPFIKSI